MEHIFIIDFGNEQCAPDKEAVEYTIIHHTGPVDSSGCGTQSDKHPSDTGFTDTCHIRTMYKSAQTELLIRAGLSSKEQGCHKSFWLASSPC